MVAAARVPRDSEIYCSPAEPGRVRKVKRSERLAPGTSWLPHPSRLRCRTHRVQIGLRQTVREEEEIQQNPTAGQRGPGQCHKAVPRPGFWVLDFPFKHTQLFRRTRLEAKTGRQGWLENKEEEDCLQTRLLN